MKSQWTFIFALVFALVIAVFSVVNVELVPVDYVFGTAQFPLIVVILGSALAGGLAVGLFGTFRIMRMRRQIRTLTKEKEAAQTVHAAQFAQAGQAVHPEETKSTESNEEVRTEGSTDV